MYLWNGILRGTTEAGGIEFLQEVVDAGFRVQEKTSRRMLRRLRRVRARVPPSGKKKGPGRIDEHYDQSTRRAEGVKRAKGPVQPGRTRPDGRAPIHLYSAPTCPWRTLMALGGYAGRVGHVDLTSGAVTYAPIPEEWARKYIGARGLGVRYALEAGPTVDALGPLNVLSFISTASSSHP